jgi:uncharacterized membrane protein YfcA
MKSHNFPYIAFFLSLMLMPVVIIGAKTGADGASLVPLLTLLVMSEVAFIVTAIGAYIGIRYRHSVARKHVYMAVTVACALLSVWFMFIGISLWPL